jgi:hypothetical protein
MTHPIISEFTTEFEHQYIDAVKNSFNKALNCESKLPPWILNIQGMSGKKYRHFINNLSSSILNCRYLEIGSWKGSTLCSALFNNRISSYVVENWSEFGGPKEEFNDNVKKCINESTSEIKFTFEEKNYVDVNYSNIGKYNLYFYDGPHLYEDQFNALSLCLNSLDDEFIFICDDWNWDVVEKATKDVISKLNLKVLYSIDIKCELIDGWHGEFSDWHNGYYIAVIKKEN